MLFSEKPALKLKAGFFVYIALTTLIKINSITLL